MADEDYKSPKQLRDYSISEIESVISKALGELTAKDYRTRISNIAFDANKIGDDREACEIQLRIWEPIHLRRFGRATSNEEPSNEEPSDDVPF